jgi:hypothetical protein
MSEEEKDTYTKTTKDEGNKRQVHRSKVAKHLLTKTIAWTSASRPRAFGLVKNFNMVDTGKVLLCLWGKLIVRASCLSRLLVCSGWKPVNRLLLYMKTVADITLAVVDLLDAE